MKLKNKLWEIKTKIQDARIDFQASVRTIRNLFAPKGSMVSDELEKLDKEVETRLKEIEQDLDSFRMNENNYKD